jgi:hypothetical protein
VIDVSCPKFQSALACARTGWLKELLIEYLPQLIPLTNSERDLDTAKLLDTAIKQQFSERGLSNLSQQKNRITDVRNAIKVFDPQHPTLDIIGLSKEEWIEVNSVAGFSTHNRETQFLTNPNAIAKTAFNLIKSDRWSQIAAGLAVVTGRRISEILKTAQFEMVSPYSVMFTGAAKRRNESIPLTFEIPTLVPASIVIDAISRLRGQLDTSDLTNRQINDKYEQPVAVMCDRYFQDLVPTRDGKNNLYTHLFRAVYATIATHWFCPTTVSDLEFRAYIQGHFKVLDEQNLSKQTDMASQKHYWDYKISDGHGNIDGRLGIRLKEDNVRVIQHFAPQEKEPQMAENYGDLVKVTVWSRDRDRLAKIQDRFGLDNRATTNNYVIGLAQSLIDAADKLNLTPEVLISKLDKLRNDGTFSTLQISSTTEAAETKPLSLPSSVDHREDKLQIPTDSSRTKTDAPSTILISNMNTQQQALSDLTTAIYDLIEVIQSDRQLPRQERDFIPQPDRPVSQAEPQPSSQQDGRAIQNPESQLSPLQANSSKIRARINRYIDAIMAYNDTPNRPHNDKWAVSLSILRRLSGYSAPPISAVIDARKDEIDAHNAKHNFDLLHNRKSKNAPKIESVIHLD